MLISIIFYVYKDIDSKFVEIFCTYFMICGFILHLFSYFSNLQEFNFVFKISFFPFWQYLAGYWQEILLQHWGVYIFFQYCCNFDKEMFDHLIGNVKRYFWNFVFLQYYHFIVENSNVKLLFYQYWYFCGQYWAPV